MINSKAAISGPDSRRARVNIIKDKCMYLYKFGRPFLLTKTGGTYTLTSDYWNQKAFRGGFSFKDLNFINSVSRHITKERIAINFIDTDYRGEGIEYVKVGNYKPGEKIEKLLYVDITSAYWQTAYSLGIISESIFKRGKDIEKKVRLAALGSLARKESQWRFDGKDLVKLPGERNPNENVWFAICKRVSDIMLKISNKAGKDFVFYWVDGIYLKDNQKTLDAVLKAFLSFGYGTTMERVEYVEFHETGFKVQGAITGDIKNFSYSMSKNGKKPIAKQVENRRLLEMAQEIMFRSPSKGKSPAKNKSKTI